MRDLFARCPKSARFAGALAIGWFLLRVVPKPSRAAYPCQRVAAGMGAGFLSYLAGLTGLFLLRRKVHNAAALALVAGVAVASYISLAQPAPANKIAQILTPAEGPNKPMGKAKGIFPGRVVWEQDFSATTWDGSAGHWWHDGSINQATADRMFSKTLQTVTGATSDKQAWDKLFRFRNEAAGRAGEGYRKGKKIVVKLNCNADEALAPWSNKGYPSPHVVLTLVRELIEVAGVPGDAITLTDPSRWVGDNIYNKVRSAGPEYQKIVFEGQAGQPAPQRVKPAPDMKSPIWFDLPGGKRSPLYLPKSYSEAAYIINYALVRPHRVFAVTLAAKNQFGAVYDPELKIFKPSMLHAYALWDYPTPNKVGETHSHPELLGHPMTGGKTILYFLDGLYTSHNQTTDVVRWKTLDGRWFSSMLMSLDPVALDSVGYDLITSEPNLTDGNPSFNGNADSYLHEAALADNPPSKSRYDPENNGKILVSQGVHEHWSNLKEKKYSRNLGKTEGIELVAIH
jgi:hypothetical protein